MLFLLQVCKHYGELIHWSDFETNISKTSNIMWIYTDWRVSTKRMMCMAKHLNSSFKPAMGVCVLFGERVAYLDANEIFKEQRPSEKSWYDGSELLADGAKITDVLCWCWRPVDAKALISLMHNIPVVLERLLQKPWSKPTFTINICEYMFQVGV